MKLLTNAGKVPTSKHGINAGRRALCSKESEQSHCQTANEATRCLRAETVEHVDEACFKGISLRWETRCLCAQKMVFGPFDYS